MHKTIQLLNVGKSFSRKILFTNLSYTFEQKTYHLSGKNGVGKSSLLRLLVGLDEVDSGSIILNKQYPITDNRVNEKKLFYVPDDLPVYPFLTGKELLLWLAKARTNDIAEMNGLFERLELQAHLHTRIADMSFGTKKKFLLASALIGHPDFIILDEPLNGLDKASQQALLTMLKEKSAHCGIILTTHHDAHLELLDPVKIELADQALVDLNVIQI